MTGSERSLDDVAAADAPRPRREVPMSRPVLLAIATVVLIALVSLVRLVPSAFDDDPEPPEAARRSPATSAVGPRKTSTTRPSPTTETTAPQEPADGRDLAACADRTCEIWARTGDVLRFDPPATAEVRVDQVAGDQITVVEHSDQSQFTASIGGRGTIDLGDLRIEVVGFSSDGAYLRIRPL